MVNKGNLFPFPIFIHFISFSIFLESFKSVLSMFVEDPNVIYLGYVLGLVGMFGIGFEFMALKIPNFLKNLKKETLRDILLGFINSWQFGFLLMFIATNFLSGIIGDLVFFLGLGIAIPDLPKRFRRYWKYIIAIIMLSGVMPSWLVEFFRTLQPEGNGGEGVQGDKEVDIERSEDTVEVEWKEPDYLRGGG